MSNKRGAWGVNKKGEEVWSGYLYKDKAHIGVAQFNWKQSSNNSISFYPIKQDVANNPFAVAIFRVKEWK